MLILGSCMAINLSYSGSCKKYFSQNCSNKRCYCDQNSHIFNDCCNDVADIGCYPSYYSSTKLLTMVRQNQKPMQYFSHSCFQKNLFFKYTYI